MSASADTPDISLSELDAFLWEAAADGENRVPRDVLREGAVAAQSPVTTWTLIAPNPCGVYTRNWVPLQRFRGKGRYTITLQARDASGLTSAPARRSFLRR